MRIPGSRISLFDRRFAVAAVSVVLAVAALLWVSPVPRTATENLPQAISDAEFWQMIEDFSESNGFFRSDNFVSNERQYQWVVSELKKDRAPGGVYLGVGPDQNFTYLVALEPKLAFIIDIRRQNMIEHLLYKALFELSADRIEFLSRLFSRPQPEGLSADDTADSLLHAYAQIEHDEGLFQENLKAVSQHLTATHRFKLSAEDERSLQYVYSAFYAAGPDLTYTFSVGQGAFGGVYSNGGMRGMPTYAQLMMETDGEGSNRSYLSSAENFRIMQDLQKRNVVVPLVGDFAGEHALRAVARYLKQHDATVTAFYTSNVEQYLFQQNLDWRHFYENVSELPIDDKSLFIRSVASGRRLQTPDARASLLSSMQEMLKEFKAGRLESYSKVIRMSH
jgi:hypothetical protein